MFFISDCPMGEFCRRVEEQDWCRMGRFFANPLNARPADWFIINAGTPRASPPGFSRRTAASAAFDRPSPSHRPLRRNAFGLLHLFSLRKVFGRGGHSFLGRVPFAQQAGDVEVELRLSAQVLRA